MDNYQLKYLKYKLKYKKLQIGSGKKKLHNYIQQRDKSLMSKTYRKSINRFKNYDNIQNEINNLIKKQELMKSGHYLGYGTAIKCLILARIAFRQKRFVESIVYLTIGLLNIKIRRSQINCTTDWFGNVKECGKLNNQSYEFFNLERDLRLRENLFDLNSRYDIYSIYSNAVERLMTYGDKNNKPLRNRADYETQKVIKKVKNIALGKSTRPRPWYK